jgi:hypothetical protein
MTPKTKTKVGVRIIPEGRLRLAKVPTAELGDAALQAQHAAGLDAADFIIIAVTPGAADDALARALADHATSPPAAS